MKKHNPAKFLLRQNAIDPKTFIKIRHICLMLCLLIVGLLEGHSGIAQSNGQKQPEVTTESLFIYRLTPTEKYSDIANWTVETNRIIQNHAKFLDELGKKEILIFAGRTLFRPGDKNLFGIVVMKAKSLDEAKNHLVGDPALENKIFQIRSILPFSMGITHFENMISKPPDEK